RHGRVGDDSGRPPLGRQAHHDSQSVEVVDQHGSAAQDGYADERRNREPDTPETRTGPLGTRQRAAEEHNGDPPESAHRAHSSSTTARGPASATELPLSARRPIATWPWTSTATAPPGRYRRSKPGRTSQPSNARLPVAGPTSS